MTHTQPFTGVVANQDGSSVADGEVQLSSQYIAEGTPPMLTGAIPSTSGVVYLRTGPFEGTPHPAPRRQCSLPPHEGRSAVTPRITWPCARAVG
jgi:hypothetical protein